MAAEPLTVVVAQLADFAIILLHSTADMNIMFTLHTGVFFAVTVVPGSSHK